MDLEYGPQYDDFRAEVINFVKENENTKFTISKINTIDNFVNNVGLFEEKRVYVAKNCKGINEENLKKILNKDLKSSETIIR